MNADWIVAAFLVIDTMLERLEHRNHVLAQVPDADILPVAVVAAKFFQNHHERAVCVLGASGSLSGPLSVSRFHRRLHALADCVVFIATALGEGFALGDVFVIDSIPLPICRRVRARRCRKVRGREYCGYCAAKKEQFFGWRLHLICTPAGLPVSFTRLPAAFHDLTPLHALAFGLAPGARLFGAKADNSAAAAASLLAETAVRLIPVRKANMAPHAWFLDEVGLRQYRHTIETVNSPWEKRGVERLYARTNTGFDLTVYASLIALTCTNMN